MADETLEACDEIWKPIPDHPYYEASNLGRIRSIDRVIAHGGERVPVRRLRGKILKLAVNPHGGHLQVNLDRKTFRVPGLVMRAFVGECPPGLEVCHHDDDTENNRLDNMRYDTRLSNHADRKKNGRRSGRKKKLHGAQNPV
jgi:hypothetical protein